MACLSMRLGGLGISASVIRLAVDFLLVKSFATAGRQAGGSNDDVCRSPDLFHGEQFAAEYICCWRELLADAGTEQLTQNGYVEMAMDASPTATFEVI